YFFFQAEDGIRDFHVTGVQTCALPIYSILLPDKFERSETNGTTPEHVRKRSFQLHIDGKRIAFIKVRIMPAQSKLQDHFAIRISDRKSVCRERVCNTVCEECCRG